MMKTEEGKKIKIISAVASRWQDLGDQLEFDEFGAKLDAIKFKPKISVIQKDAVVKCSNTG